MRIVSIRLSDETSRRDLSSSEDRCAVQTRQLMRNMGYTSVLTAIELQIECGEIVTLRGANGAGKTTLLRCLAGALRPTSGDVLWFGRPAALRSTDRRLVGFVAHESGLYPELTAQENLAFAARMFGVAKPVERAAEWLQTCGLQTWKHHPVNRLSRGMRQRVSLARGFIHDPPILLLDEPFSGLDDESRQWLARLLFRLREQGRAICFSSHGEEVGLGFKKRVLRLEAGSLLELKVASRQSA